jgi:uncharacterized SAM-binding protein YcdF (DUF218 family)
MMKKAVISVVSLLVILVGIFLYYAPRFLVYADRPVKSDVVVLFSSIDNQTREKEAEELLREGYARYLLVPASGGFHEIAVGGQLTRLSPDFKVGKKLLKIRKHVYYKTYHERTHIEALEAKRMMDDMGLVSAIIVSSPYHMRRLHMICQKVFGEQSRLFSYVPSRYEQNPATVRDMDRADWSFVIQEYIKICWFSLYSPVSMNSA